MQNLLLLSLSFLCLPLAFSQEEFDLNDYQLKPDLVETAPWTEDSEFQYEAEPRLYEEKDIPQPCNYFRSDCSPNPRRFYDPEYFTRPEFQTQGGAIQFSDEVMEIY